MDEWRISSRTFALPTGGGAVHAYIAVKDETGRVVDEYHGFQVDRETGDIAGGNPVSYLPGSRFPLEARRIRGEHWPSRRDLRVHEEEVFRGSREQVREIQAELDQAVGDINSRNLKYGALHFLSESQNSNSVYSTLMQVANDKANEMGVGSIDIPGRLLRDDIVFDNQSRSSWAPGIHRNLLPKEHPRHRRKVHHHYLRTNHESFRVRSSAGR